jgi:TatD DNase family protein
MLYDTHAHLNLAAFDQDCAEVIAQAQFKGVLINNIGTQKDTSLKAVELAKKHEGVFAVVGLHPGHTIFAGDDHQEGIFEKPESEFDYEYYKKLAADPKVVGIGECGLDYYRIPEGMTLDQVREVQSGIFRSQIDLALELDKVLVIHCRSSKGSFDAYDDVLEILSSYEKLPRFEIHSYTADWNYCQKFLDLGAYVALNAIVSFDKSGVLAEVVKNCPLDKMILETDAPYLAPAPFRGKRNQSDYVEYVARWIADARGISYEEVAETTTKNARELFRIKN